MFKKIQKLSIVIFLIIGFILGLGFSVFAWTNPSQNPPLGGGMIQTDTSGLKIVTTTKITSGNFTVNTGNVGIGTTTPGYALQVVSSGNAVPAVGVYGASASQTANLLEVAKNIGATPLFVIGSGGNVGIGTTTPAIGKLVISGGDLNMTGNKIINVSTPISGSDVATKAYVDAQAGGSAFPIRCGWSSTNGTSGSCTPAACPAGYSSSTVQCLATGYGVDCSGLTSFGYYCSSGNSSYYGLMTGFCERWCYK